MIAVARLIGTLQCLRERRALFDVSISTSSLQRICSVLCMLIEGESCTTFEVRPNRGELTYLKSTQEAKRASWPFLGRRLLHDFWLPVLFHRRMFSFALMDRKKEDDLLSKLTDHIKRLRLRQAWCDRSITNNSVTQHCFPTLKRPTSRL